MTAPELLRAHFYARGLWVHIRVDGVLVVIIDHRVDPHEQRHFYIRDWGGGAIGIGHSHGVDYVDLHHPNSIELLDKIVA